MISPFVRFTYRLNQGEGFEISTRGSPFMVANLHIESDHDTQDGAVESPPSRSVEQEVAAGRTASTPVAMIGGVVVVIVALFAIVLALVVLAYALS